MAESQAPAPVGVAPGLIALVLLAVAVAALVYWLFASEAADGRREWRALAGQLGLTFCARDACGIARGTAYYSLSGGHSRRARNLVSGTYRGHTVRCFDYWYTEGSGQYGGTHHETVAIVVSPVRLRPMLVRPEDASDRFRALVDGPDIDLESDAFDRRYYVWCRDRRFAYDILHPRAMGLLLTEEPTILELTWHGMLVTYPSAGYLSIPGGVRQLLDLACDLVETLPVGLLESRCANANAPAAADGY